MDLDGLGVKTEAFLLIGKELLDILSLVSLKLNDFAHLGIGHYGSIAGEFLLNDLQNLLLVKLLRETLDCSQGLASITLLDSYVNVILRLLRFTSVFVGLGEGIVGLEIFDGHKLGRSRVSLGNGSCVS